MGLVLGAGSVPPDGVGVGAGVARAAAAASSSNSTRCNSRMAASARTGLARASGRESPPGAPERWAERPGKGRGQLILARSICSQGYPLCDLQFYSTCVFLQYNSGEKWINTQNVNHCHISAISPPEAPQSGMTPPRNDQHFELAHPRLKRYWNERVLSSCSASPIRGFPRGPGALGGEGGGLGAEDAAAEAADPRVAHVAAAKITEAPARRAHHHLLRLGLRLRLWRGGPRGGGATRPRDRNARTPRRRRCSSTTFSTQALQLSDRVSEKRLQKTCVENSLPCSVRGECQVRAERGGGSAGDGGVVSGRAWHQQRGGERQEDEGHGGGGGGESVPATPGHWRAPPAAYRRCGRRPLTRRAAAPGARTGRAVGASSTQIARPTDTARNLRSKCATARNRDGERESTRLKKIVM
ncbi:Protein of unknown function [Gryllus bimaculatus]|nr:Protein of unknown function [Gryllus bimaculatus]